MNEINNRKYQERFRNDLLKIYRKCIITDKHTDIIPFSVHINYDRNK